MENVCHPLCTCGQPVLVHEWRVPNYDDGGGLDSFDIEYEFDSECGNCYILREIVHAHEPRDEDDDDLPF
jgi:hypothetical protein